MMQRLRFSLNGHASLRILNKLMEKFRQETLRKENIPRPIFLVLTLTFALLPFAALPTLARPISNTQDQLPIVQEASLFFGRPSTPARQFLPIPRSPFSAIPVTTAGDELNTDGDCSLREAIQAANTDSAIDTCPAGSGADTILLPAGMYTLTLVGADEEANQTGDLDILDDLSITGSGTNSTWIDANGPNLNDRAFDIQAAAVITFENLTLQGGQPLGGFPAGCGGAIHIPFAGSGVNIKNGRLTGNMSSASGGAICNWGTLTITNSTLDDNQVTATSGNGGALWSDLGAIVTINNSTLNNNAAPVAGVGGGAIFADGMLNVNNSTLSGNSTLGNGGAIWSSSTTNLRNVTFYGNSAGSGQAIFMNAGTIDLQNSILFGHLGNTCANFSGTSLNNLVDDATCGLAANPATNFDANLADNGGPTYTHALFAGSNAIHTGGNNCPDHTNTPLATDQRGVVRPQGPVCDIGSFEWLANAAPLAFDDVYTTTQDLPLTVSAPGVLANDSDPDFDLLSAVLVNAPATGTLTLNANGGFDYTPPWGYTGTLTFTYVAADGMGTAVQFDGTQSYIDLGDSYENFGDFSVEAWVYRDFATGAFEEIFSKDVINSFSIDNLGQLHFNLGDGAVWGTGISSVSTIPLNQWTHLAATWDSSTGEAKVYINGLLENTSTISIVVGNNAAVRGIGQKPAFDASTFPGVIDEVRVWDVVRTGPEIRANMWGQLTGSETGLIGYYKLDDGAGLTATDSAGGIHGTLTDFVPGSEWASSLHPFSNLAAVTINILPSSASADLAVPAFIASPNDVCQGEFYALTFAIANQGSLDASSHQISLYEDAEPGGFTEQTFTITLPGMGAGQTRYFSLSTSSEITGTRYLKVLVDGTNMVSETNELNNSAVIPLNVQPDPPPSGSILINGGAFTATFPSLTLTLFAADTGNCATAPAEMHFNYDGLTTPWEPYTTTKAIVALSTGEVRVGVQFKDEHNNVSPWFDAVIWVVGEQKIYFPLIAR